MKRKLFAGGVAKDVKVFFLKRRAFLNGTMLEYSIIGVVFLLLTFFYTAGVIFNITHQLFIEGIGDGTAGFLWLNFADHDANPVFGFSNLVNYPTGADLNSPTYITYSALIFPLWFFTRLFSPIVALNIVTLFGFWSAAMGMYWLVKKLAADWRVAFFAGFAVTFTPYHIMKSSSHLAYIFSIVLILIIAAFIGLWRKQTLWRTIALGATLALAFYTDGYYILLGTVLLFCLFVGASLYAYFTKESLRLYLHKIRYFCLAAVMFIIFMIPLLYVQVTSRDEVNSTLAQARGAISDEIMFYSAKPIDFLLPSVHHPLLMKNPDFQQIETYKNSRSNSSENTLYVGYTLIILCAIGLTFAIATYLLRRKRQTLDLVPATKARTFGLIFAMCAVGVPVLLLWMLRPEVSMLGKTITLPSGYLIESGIALWRVMSRFFLPFHVLVVLFASMSLAVLILSVRTKIKGYWITAGVAVLTVILGIEFAATTSRPPYDFNNLPYAYTWLRDQSDIQVVAELPMSDRPLEQSYKYVTAQMVHGKKLINSHLTKHEIGRRNALGSIDNPETVDYVINRGAQAIITHDEPCKTSLQWGTLALQDDNRKRNEDAQAFGRPICIYKVNRAVSHDDYFAKLEKGNFEDAPRTVKDISYNALYGVDGNIRVMDSLDHLIAKDISVQFSARIVDTPAMKVIKSATWQVQQDGETIESGSIPGQIRANVRADKPIHISIHVDGPTPPLYQFSLRDIAVNATGR